ncbi:antibiotic biosynthesis monooxygenase [Erythrobacter insulae]|uniref:Antibiotic biosynthesis monooxygenase n=1 Tax=Erythrobacter insulae TaxID=2584124 RepID=A0A547P8P5_9SPHN|nr:putative quinol monooxygenase [Erythrobacter insulae]TRD10515.1 antibiotic biosynthesis monooxygenase [Erythrobacter insulae]
MLMVIGKATLGEAGKDAALDAFKTMIEASRAEQGCIDYAYALDVIDPSVMHITEKWTDEAALAEHFQTPHMAAFRSALGDLDVQIIDVKKFRTDEGAPLL